MAHKNDFDVGDLIWAKMKGYPFWPGMIVEPPADTKSAHKKARHYVLFFGSENYAWIQDENIVHHSEKMLHFNSSKKKSTLLKVAIQQITEEAQQNDKLLFHEKDSPKKFPDASTSYTKKKISKVQRMKGKTKSPKVRKMAVPKRHTMDESVNKRTSPAPKAVPERHTMDESANKRASPAPLLSKIPTRDFPELIKPNLDHNRIAVITALDDHPPPPTAAHTSSGITGREYVELQPAPPLNLHEPNEEVLAKKVRPVDKKIGFIGLGIMGQRLVKNLITTNHKVTVWNRTPQKCLEFAKVGAVLAQTPADVVEMCDIIFCCVSDSEVSKSLVFGKCGILSGLERSPPGSKGYIEMTTMDPTMSIEICEAITHKGGRYLEAPISGSRKMAEDGSLSILIAGDKDLFQSSMRCFEILAERPIYCGDEVGIGSALNLVRNMLIGITHAALAEAMLLVELCNLSKKDFLEIVENGPLSSTLFAEKGESMLLRSFETNTSLKYQQKDLTLALSLYNNYEHPLVLTKVANELFKSAKLHRYSDHDVSAVYLGAKY